MLDGLGGSQVRGRRVGRAVLGEEGASAVIEGVLVESEQRVGGILEVAHQFTININNLITG
jgi:hypothetical protein